MRKRLVQVWFPQGQPSAGRRRLGRRGARHLPRSPHEHRWWAQRIRPPRQLPRPTPQCRSESAGPRPPRRPRRPDRRSRYRAPGRQRPQRYPGHRSRRQCRSERPRPRPPNRRVATPRVVPRQVDTATATRTWFVRHLNRKLADLVPTHGLYPPHRLRRQRNPSSIHRNRLLTRHRMNEELLRELIRRGHHRRPIRIPHIIGTRNVMEHLRLRRQRNPGRINRRHRPIRRRMDEELLRELIHRAAPASIHPTTPRSPVRFQHPNAPSSAASATEPRTHQPPSSTHPTPYG